jgi:uncharacterized protein
MFEYFTLLADWMTYAVFGFSAESKSGASIHFFIEDTSKIMVLLVVMIYSIAWLRSSLNIERVRDYLQGKHKWFGYLVGSIFGAITPFCSCSSIPLFLGFTSARIPLGVTMAFLITSPMVNEVAIVLLGTILGWKFTVIYATLGILIGIIGGAFLDILKSEKYLKPFIKDSLASENDQVVTRKVSQQSKRISIQERHLFAKTELTSIFGRIWKWIIIGVGVGALIHGFVPKEWILDHLSSGDWWSVPAAVLIGIPLYSNASGVIPVIETLLIKGLPVGTALALMMSIVGASFPEFVLLKQVMEWKLLIRLFLLLLFFFTITGFIFNSFNFLIV